MANEQREKCNLAPDIASSAFSAVEEPEHKQWQQHEAFHYYMALMAVLLQQRFAAGTANAIMQNPNYSGFKF